MRKQDILSHFRNMKGGCVGNNGFRYALFLLGVVCTEGTEAGESGEFLSKLGIPVIPTLGKWKWGQDKVMPQSPENKAQRHLYFLNMYEM